MYSSFSVNRKIWIPVYVVAKISSKPAFPTTPPSTDVTHSPQFCIKMF